MRLRAWPGLWTFTRLAVPLLIFLPVILLPARGAALQAPDGGEGPRTLQGHPATGSIAIDGRLDEEDWARASVATGFVQLEPAEGSPASQPTEVRVLYGLTALYIGALLREDPEAIRRPLTRRDHTGEADYFTVSIDGAGTGRSALRFGVTAAGVQIDAVEEGFDIDPSWDAVWESAVRLGPDGWVVEMAIPYSMLRFPRGERQTWGIQFQRRRAHTGERAFWQPVRREEMGVGIIAGRLEGLQGIAPRRNVQVRPYTLSRFRAQPQGGVGPLYDYDTGFDAGVDVKVALGSHVILDATINPDFGQVEADPAVLNLTTFETFFPERRPFFLEGTGIFNYTFAPGEGGMLYTRRIGSRGRILGAGKVTGTTPSGLSFGLLTAATGDGHEASRIRGRELQPNLLYGAARLQQEFGDRSYVGLAATYFDGFGASSPWDHVRVLVAGADWDYRFDDYRWTGTATLTHQGFGEIYGLRPSTGIGLYASTQRIRGDFTWGILLRAFSPEFQPNDMGFFRQSDIIRAGGNAQLLLHGGQPFGPFRLAWFGGTFEQRLTYAERTNLGAAGSWYTWWLFRGYQHLGVRGALLDFGGVDVRETRGLGPVKNLPAGSVIVEYSTDTRRRLVLAPRAAVALFGEGGTGWNAQLEGRWLASDRLALSLTGRYERRDRLRAWVANEAFRRTEEGFFLGRLANRHPADQTDFLALDATAALDKLFARIEPVSTSPEATDYFVSVFGARDQSSLDTVVRATYTFSPHLSLQLYSQLFAARFRHDNFRLLASAHELPHLPAYPRRRDESRRSLNLNAVLRWEYRPGSTLFAVWTHGRFGLLGGYAVVNPHDETAPGFDRTTLGLALDAFELQPTNVFLIKLNYLLMR